VFAVSGFFFFFYFLSPLHNTRCGLCLPVIDIIFPSNVLQFALTGKSYPPLRQEMQDAFRPEHMRHDAECARVDFPCPSPWARPEERKDDVNDHLPSTAGFSVL